MKPLIPILFLLLVWQIAGAAPYDCFIPGQRQFFVNAGGYLRGIEVKNVQAFPGYKIYSLFKTLRGSYTSTSTSILTPRGSWVGEDVVVYNDGMHTIETIWGDTVYIRSQAQQGEEWVFHTGNNAPEYFKAKVMNIDTMTVSGTLDSVKSIRIDAYLNNNPIADPLNGYTFKLSKDHGLVETFELYTFPYHAPNAPIQAGNDYYFDKMGGISGAVFHICNFEPADNKLHNWQVGDVLEYTAIPMFYGPYPNADIQVNYLDTIVARQQGANWVSYETRGWRTDLINKTTLYSYQYTYKKIATTGTRYYTDKWKFCDGYMPEEEGYFNLLYYREADTNFCFTGKWYRENPADINKSNGKYVYASPFEWWYYSEYKERIGLVSYFWGGHDATTDTTFRYALLNNTPCHDHYYLATQDIPAKGTKICISPNPVQNELTVELPGMDNNTLYTLTIVNMQGMTVFKSQSHQQKTAIDVHNLPAGTYILRLSNGQFTANSLFIKEE